MHKSETPNGERANLNEWAKHLRSKKNRCVGKADSQRHWASVRGITKKHIRNEVRYSN